MSHPQSAEMNRRRQRAKAGVSSYLDWHYSVSGSLTEQATVIAQGMRTVRDRLSGRRIRPLLPTRGAQTGRTQGQVNTTVDERDFVDQMSSMIQQRLHDHIFCHLTEWTEDDFRKLVREVRGEGRLLVKLFNQRVVEQAIDQLRGQEVPIYQFKSGLPSELKLGIAGTSALVSGAMIYQLIQRISKVIAYRLARRAMITTMYRGGIVVSGAEGASMGAVGCVAGGPVGIGACAVGGFILGLLGSEWVLNRVDEMWSRPELERELHDQVDAIFDRFERSVTRSILGLTQGFFERSDAPKELRLIDLFR